MTVTAATITDEQIRQWECDELLRLRSSAKRWAVVDLATEALADPPGPDGKDGFPRRGEARARCSEILNARRAK